ncbi:hypothetical protein DLAC_04228 [Tieghemostelium lacteum]|uniref:Uncharacterized protein n=1 Tax=Tieghemostelium lacteum TaxID=361077 RepID=A0A151ZSJ9_TIELA|nr:hypothetical protein DLAC_04228 [Tieghemostelium lacteum]|eukprot:KYQ96909.1 hypothetical protein DLAC_04228 [Tieghemostelium lacteum]
MNRFSILSIFILLSLFYYNSAVLSQSINTVITQNAETISITFSGVDFTQNPLGNIIADITSNTGWNSECQFVSVDHDYYDLTPLQLLNTTNAPYVNFDVSNNYYYFNLCGKLSSSVTNGVYPYDVPEIQSIQVFGSTKYVTGRSFRNTYTINSSNNITLFYNSETSTCHRVTYYNILCNPTVDLSIKSLVEKSTCQYYTTIETKYACPTKLPGPSFSLIYETPTNNIMTFNYARNRYPSSIEIPNLNLTIPIPPVEPMISTFSFDNSTRLVTLLGTFTTIDQYKFTLGDYTLTPTYFSVNNITLSLQFYTDSGDLKIFYLSTPKSYFITGTKPILKVIQDHTNKKITISTNYIGNFTIKGSVLLPSSITTLTNGQGGSTSVVYQFDQLNSLGGDIFISLDNSNFDSTPQLVYPQKLILSQISSADVMTIQWNFNDALFPIENLLLYKNPQYTDALNYQEVFNNTILFSQLSNYYPTYIYIKLLNIKIPVLYKPEISSMNFNNSTRVLTITGMKGPYTNYNFKYGKIAVSANVYYDRQDLNLASYSQSSIFQVYFGETGFQQYSVSGFKPKATISQDYKSKTITLKCSNFGSYLVKGSSLTNTSITYSSYTSSPPLVISFDQLNNSGGTIFIGDANSTEFDSDPLQVYPLTLEPTITQDQDIVTLNFPFDISQLVSSMSLFYHNISLASNTGNTSKCTFISDQYYYYDLSQFQLAYGQKYSADMYYSDDILEFNICGYLKQNFSSSKVQSYFRNSNTAHTYFTDNQQYSISSDGLITLIYSSEVSPGKLNMASIRFRCAIYDEGSLSYALNSSNNIYLDFYSYKGCRTKLEQFKPTIFNNQSVKFNISTFGFSKYFEIDVLKFYKEFNYEPIITSFDFNREDRTLKIIGTFTDRDKYTFTFGSLNVAPTFFASNYADLNFSGYYFEGKVTMYYEGTPSSKSYTIPSIPLKFNLNINRTSRQIQISTKLFGPFEIQGTAFKDNSSRILDNTNTFTYSYDNLNIGESIFISINGPNGTIQSDPQLIYPFDNWVSGVKQIQDNYTINFNMNLDTFPITSISPNVTIISKNSSSITLKLNSQFPTSLTFNEDFNYVVSTLNPIVTNFTYASYRFSVIEGIFFENYEYIIQVGTQQISYQIINNGSSISVDLDIFSDSEIQVFLNLTNSVPSPISFTAEPPLFFGDPGYTGDVYFECKFCWGLKQQGGAIDPSYPLVFYNSSYYYSSILRFYVPIPFLAIGELYFVSKSGAKSNVINITPFDMRFQDYTVPEFKIYGQIVGTFLIDNTHNNSYGPTKLEVKILYNDGGQMNVPYQYKRDGLIGYLDINVEPEIKPLTLRVYYGESLLFEYGYTFPAVTLNSLVKPIISNGQSQVTISGDNFFGTNYVVDIAGYSCSEAYALSNQTLVCTLNPKGMTNAELFYHVTVTMAGCQSAQEKIAYFLPRDRSCPSGCEKHGSCNDLLECECDEGYASYDCSIKVDKKHLDTPEYDLGVLSFGGDKGKSFEVLLSHVGEFTEMQYPAQLYFVPELDSVDMQFDLKNFTQKFNTIVLIKQNLWGDPYSDLNLYEYTGEIVDNFPEYPPNLDILGDQLQLMKTSVAIKFASDANPNIQSNTMNLIFEITTDDGKDKLTIETHDQNILFSNGDSYLMMSVATRSMDLNGSNILPVFIKPRIIGDNSFSNYTSEYSSYVAIQFPSGGSILAMTFSSFVKKENNDWKIAVGIVVPVVVLGAIAGAIILLVKKNPAATRRITDKIKSKFTSTPTSNTVTSSPTPTITTTTPTSGESTDTIQPIDGEQKH